MLFCALALSAAALADNHKVLSYPMKNGGLEVRASDNLINTYMDVRLPIPGFAFPITVGEESNSYSLLVDTYIRSSWIKTTAWKTSSSAVNTTRPYKEYNKAVANYCNGFYFTDKWLVDGNAMNMSFGVAGGAALLYASYKSFDGVLSLWPTPYSDSGPDTSIVNALKRAKAIDTRVFSLWMGTEEVGSITFGGLDHTKYNGPLYKFPIYEPVKGTGTYGVTFSVRRFYGYDDARGGALIQEGMTRCTIASGSKNGGLPSGVAVGLAKLFDAQLAANVPEALAAGYSPSVTVIQYQGEGGIALDVGAVVLKFPLKYILMDTNDDRLDGDAVIGQWYRISYDSPQCIFGQNYFSREYYTVFDFDHMEIAVAPAAHDTDASATSQLETVGPTGISAITAPAYSDTLSSPVVLHSPTAWTSDYVFA